MSEPFDPVAELVTAVKAGKAARTRRVLEAHPELRDRLDDPLPGFHFGGTALGAAVATGERELVDLLLEAGADINQKSHWWAGGFGVLDGDHQLHDYLISRGAVVDAYSAARLGMMDRLRELVAADPAAARMRGGDGQTPLHVAASIEVAEFLLEQGAEIDARDVDHESTPAQYLVTSRPEVARYLVKRGCRTDLLLAAALGDTPLVERHLAEDPASIRTIVSSEHFPMADSRAGGHIYRWTIGANKTAHQIAREQGHTDTFELLMRRSPPSLQLMVACRLGDGERASAVLAANPALRGSPDPEDRRALADSAKDEDAASAALMIDAGWPLDVPGDDDGTPLHWASFHGSTALVRRLLEAGAPVDRADRTYGGTPLGWALYGSRHGWTRTADHAGTVDALLRAGAVSPAAIGGVDADEAVLAVLRRHQR